MSATNPVQSVAGQHKATDLTSAAPVEWGIGSLLNAQADLIAGAEATMTDWLHRRHEAVADAQQLIACMHTGSDPVDAFKAQQEWMSRSFRRLAADAEACHSATQRLMDRAPSWFPQGAWLWSCWQTENSTTAAVQAAATRAAAAPLRMAENAD